MQADNMVLKTNTTTQSEIQETSVLIENHLYLVVNAARKFEGTGVNLMDIISIGTIGLIVGVKTYESTGKTIAAHLSLCIENEITKYFRKYSHRKAN